MGYDQTTIRAVAEKAGVDSALVMHYFSSKEGLLQAAMEWPMDMDEAMREVVEGDPAHLGERLVRKVCEMWEDDTTRHPLTVILRNTIQREDAAQLGAQLASLWLEQAMVGRLAEHIDHSDLPLRGALAHSALMGLVLIRYVACYEPLASASVDAVVEQIGPTIQHYLFGDMGSAGPRGPIY